jgi:hypothetical protein
VHDKRQHPRREIEIELVLRSGDGAEGTGRTHDMSQGGAYILTSMQLGFGSTITIELMLPGLGKTSFPAVVRWIKPDGVGVQFGLLGARQTHALGDLVAGKTSP